MLNVLRQALFGLKHWVRVDPLATRRKRPSGSHGKDTANGAGAVARRKRQDAYGQALNADITNPTISDEAFAARYPEIADAAFKGLFYSSPAGTVTFSELS